MIWVDSRGASSSVRTVRFADGPDRSWELANSSSAIGSVPGGYVPKDRWCLRACADSGKGDPTGWWPEDRLAVSIEGVLLLNAQDSAALNRGPLGADRWGGNRLLVLQSRWQYGLVWQRRELETRRDALTPPSHEVLQLEGHILAATAVRGDRFCEGQAVGN